MKARALLDGASVPRLGAHIRLREDPARASLALLAPERVLWSDPIAAEILRLCDGERSVEVITTALAEVFEGERERIRADVITLLQELADKGLVET
ncbi:pyrroloquinoline quinone biosynthesis peptide chaperone PqqD [Polyangium spumosum]|uniref:pyrroloquinoline quinone biosynthesis peptide chaperone PqqD n=1 Tax=Polyangium spumosum TaxID=889282 RepID=UPI00197CD2D6